MKHQGTANVTARWDAGETGCSGLIVGARNRLSQHRCGEALEIVTRNAGASVDLWVWCRMTGHRLIREAHPSYVIRCNRD